MTSATAEDPGLPDLHELARDVRPPDRGAEQRARTAIDGLLLPPDSLGRLQRLAVWWAGVTGEPRAAPPDRVEVVVLAADHAIAVRGVSALPLGHTAVALRAVQEGRAAVSAVAAQLGAVVRAVDVDVAGPAGPAGSPFDVGDALDDALLGSSLLLGARLADDLVTDGCGLVVLGDLGVGSTTTAATAVGAALRRPVLDVVGRGSGIDDTAWMRKAAAVREGLRRARGRPRDVVTVLRTVGSPDLAAAVAFLLRCSAQRLPVVLDGPLVVAAAVLANRVSPVARQWWLVAERTEEPAVQRALETFAMTPVLELGVRAGAGVAGVLAAQTLRAAVAVAVGTVAADDAWPAPLHGDADDEEPVATAEADGAAEADEAAEGDVPR